MTTPQSGREAFEAWYAANDKTRKSIERDATGYRLIQTESAWQAWDAAWQAALAQQGREVAVFRNTGDSEANFIADSERLNCPTCGGSGHVNDAALPGKTEVGLG